MNIDRNADINAKILVLGIGNILWADEGFGVRCAETLHRRFEMPLGVELMDGGTQGLYLVQHLQSADKLIIFDAVDYGLEPGTLVRVEGDDVPKFTGAKKMSLHQTGFQEVLSAADLMGQLPGEIILIGVQPADMDSWGGPMSDPVRDQVDAALAHALAILADWGHTPRRRDHDIPEKDGLLGNELGLVAYEAEQRRRADQIGFANDCAREIHASGPEVHYPDGWS